MGAIRRKSRLWSALVKNKRGRIVHSFTFGIHDFDSRDELEIWVKYWIVDNLSGLKDFDIEISKLEV